MTNQNIEKLEKSRVKITSSIEWAELSTNEEKALDKLSSMMEIQGFRKGHIPKDIAKQNINDMMLLEEMAEMAITKAYGKILEESKIDAIGRPEISITKIARGSDLEFTITTAVMPEVGLPDYVKISKEENKKEEFKKEVVVEDAELEKVLKDLQKMRAHQNMHKGDVEGEEANHDHGEPEEKDLPELNDEFAKSFGKFETLEELKNKIKENIKMEKEVAQKDKLRASILEKLVEETKVEIPEVFVQSELEKMIAKMEADIAGAGFSFEDYLKQIGKSIEDLSSEWRADAEKRAKLQIIIFEISKRENLKPEITDIEKETTAITAMYKDADPMRASAYVEQMLTNEKVFAFLESQN